MLNTIIRCNQEWLLGSGPHKASCGYPKITETDYALNNWEITEDNRAAIGELNDHTKSDKLVGVNQGKM